MLAELEDRLKKSAMGILKRSYVENQAEWEKWWETSPEDTRIIFDIELLRKTIPDEVKVVMT